MSFAPDAASSTPSDPRPVAAVAAAESARPAVRHPGIAALARFLLIAILGVTIDLASKHWAFHELKQASESRVIVSNVLEFQTMLNKGALFGIGAGKTTAFLVASVFALVLVTWLFLQTPRHRWGVQIALGAILAGALGNMYDRIFVRLHETPMMAPGRGGVFVEYVGPTDIGHAYEEYPRSTGGLKLEQTEPPRLVGCVRDFIKIPTKWNLFGRKGDLWPWVFNVADMLLVGGVSILAIHIWRDRKHEAAAPPPAIPAA